MKYKFKCIVNGWVIGHANEGTDGYTQNEDEAQIYDSENMIDAEEIDNCINYCLDFIEIHPVEQAGLMEV